MTMWKAARMVGHLGIAASLHLWRPEMRQVPEEGPALPVGNLGEEIE